MRSEQDEATAPDAWEEASPVLAGLTAASVQGTVATGRQRGARIRRLGQASEMVDLLEPGRCHARSKGVDLHAGLVVPAGQPDRLERVCRYALRPPVPGDRLSTTGDGRVMLRLRHRWADGTTHLVFDPVEFLGRLAVIVPRPRIDLVLYHGVLGARAAWRAEIVRGGTSAPRGEGEAVPAETPGDQAGRDDPADAARRHARGQCWAALMRRTFGVDVLACPRCRGGRLRLIALIEQAAVIDRVLRHLGLPTTIPAPSPARAPPRAAGLPDDAADWGHDLPLSDSCS